SFFVLPNFQVLLDMGNEISNTRNATDYGNSSNTNRRNTSNAGTSNTPGTNEWNFGSIVVAAGAAAAAVYAGSKLLTELTENPPESETECRYQAEGKGITPYQGKKRCFGAYKCSYCTNQYWESCFSYANTWQKCNVCKSEVYPYRQEPLDNPKSLGKDIDKRKKHPQHLCGKCQELGYPCFKKPDYV
ncbi:hypothetical protein QYM36_000718, partial [Artemia franciscana]